VVTFTLKEIPNHKLAFAQVPVLVHQLLSMLNDTYQPLTDEDIKEDRMFGERNDCWVSNSNRNEWQVVVQHKYWSQETVDAFCGILKLLCAHNRWAVRDDNIPNKDVVSDIHVDHPEPR
jgi:hypothetical protein